MSASLGIATRSLRNVRRLPSAFIPALLDARFPGRRILRHLRRRHSDTWFPNRPISELVPSDGRHNGCFVRRARHGFLHDS